MQQTIFIKVRLYGSTVSTPPCSRSRTCQCAGAVACKYWGALRNRRNRLCHPARSRSRNNRTTAGRTNGRVGGASVCGPVQSPCTAMVDHGGQRLCGPGRHRLPDVDFGSPSGRFGRRMPRNCADVRLEMSASSRRRRRGDGCFRWSKRGCFRLFVRSRSDRSELGPFTFSRTCLQPADRQTISASAASETTECPWNR